MILLVIISNNNLLIAFMSIFCIDCWKIDLMTIREVRC